MSLSAFLPTPFPSPLRRPRQTSSKCPPRMMTAVPLQERVLRLERALVAAVLQERYTDAASLRDALIEARERDPLLHIRAQLESAVEREDFSTAARLRDELAEITERFSRGGGRRVDRIIVLKGRGDPDNALRVATVSREGAVRLGLVPPEIGGRKQNPRVYLQPTWSPSGDFVAMTEISFDLDPARLGRGGVAIAESSSRVIIMNAFDGSVMKSVAVQKPPFFYFWSPNGRSVTFLANDPNKGVTTVAMSVLQVVAAPGAGGLDLETVTGPLATGHPFLFDFCPRDSRRVVAHMGDRHAVGIVQVENGMQRIRNLTEKAGSFGAPQWHPVKGKDGREVVLFVENEMQGVDLSGRESLKVEISEGGKAVEFIGESGSGKLSLESIFVTRELDVSADDEEDDDDENQEDFSIENLLSSGTTLWESVLRRGAESLGLAPRYEETKEDEEKEEEEGSKAKGDDKDEDEKDDVEKISGFQERFKRLLPKGSSKISVEVEDDTDWEVSLQDLPINKLVMCDVDNPEKRRVLARCGGVMAFKLSPDGRALASLVTHPLTGQDELVVSAGDYSPDNVDDNEQGDNEELKQSDSTDVILSNPKTRVLAFFWSPDAKKLLFLTSLRESKAGAAQWATFDLESNKVVRYEKFVISGIYLHCLNFFDQFGASMTPWSPDSDAFCYPGRPLTQAELELDKSQAASSSPSLSALFMQKDGMSDGKRFSARVQKVLLSHEGKVEAELPEIIVENVEYACWSPC